jgi:RNA-directed DNA polymerase
VTVEDRSPGLVKVVERAQDAPAGRCHSLAPLVEVPAWTRAYRRARSEAAGGVDGVTKEPDGHNLEAHLQARHARLQTTRYRPQPLRRVSLPKGPGNRRPIGMAACEAKLVQDAVREVLAALYAQDFRGCS